MKVKLHLMGTLSNFAAPWQDVCLPEKASIGDLLDSLARQYGAEFADKIQYQGMWQVSINGSLHLLSAAAEIRIKDQDEVMLLPISFGG